MLDWKFHKNVLKIGTSASIGQIVLVLSLPILTRLYSPEEFGALATFTAVFSIAAGFSTLKYEAAIILPSLQDRNAARNLVILALIISFTTTPILIGIFFVLDGLGYAPPQTLLFLAYALPFSAIFHAFYQWDARWRRYTRSSLAQISSAAINVTLSIFLAVTVLHNQYGLVFGYLAGLTIAAMVSSWGRVLTGLRTLPSLSEIAKIAKAFRRFPTYVLPTSLVLTAGTAVVPLLIAQQYGVATAGVYAIANRFLVLPASTIGGAINESFRSTFTERSREGRPVTKVFIEILHITSILGAFLFGVMFFAMPPLFDIFLGQEFQQSAELAGVLALGAYSQFVASTFYFVFHTLSRARLGLAVQAFCAICPIGVLSVLSSQIEVETALFFTSLATAGCSFLVVGSSYWLCVQHDRKTS